MEQTKRIPNVLTIAGVDPSGGAGILADVKVMSALGTFATSVIAALTAQNTRAVTGVLPVPPAFVTQQLDTLFADVRIDAVKVGMVGESPVVHAVAEGLKKHCPKWIVLDTVMVAKSGDRLLADEAVETFKKELLPLANVITPNLPEAGVLLGREIRTQDEMYEAARDLLAMCAPNATVYLKGGHLEGDLARDVIFDGKDFVVLDAERVQTKNTHGTGCSLSSAIAAYLAKTDSLSESCRLAKQYITRAIASADELEVGAGHGPIHHFVELWK